MAVITVDDWTGKLVGVNETDFTLLASAGHFTSPGNWHAHDGSALFHVHGNEGSGNALDTVGSNHLAPTAWGAAGTGWLGDTAFKNGYSAVSAVPQLSPIADFTVDMWCYPVAGPNTAGEYFHLVRGEGYPGILLHCNSSACMAKLRALWESPRCRW